MRRIVYLPPEQIVSVLSEAEALIRAGKSVAETTRALGISELSYRHWREEFREELHRHERQRVRGARRRIN